ncbi:MAG: type 1 glutamine amidotransferase, partial [Planctomycetes bacterium]|nr:type 1 glutamine amidotransferase [Planctomycetota bacterium]
MRIHHLQHVPFEGLGTIEEWARSRGHEISRTRLHAGDPLPAPREVDWIVVTGGPMSVQDEERHPWLRAEKRCIAEMIAEGKTVLGICLGAQLVADALGARVARNRHREIGWFPVELVAEASCTGLFRGFPQRLDAFHWHGDAFDIPA